MGTKMTRNSQIQVQVGQTPNDRYISTFQFHQNSQ